MNFCEIPCDEMNNEIFNCWNLFYNYLNCKSLFKQPTQIEIEELWDTVNNDIIFLHLFSFKMPILYNENYINIFIL